MTAWRNAAVKAVLNGETDPSHREAPLHLPLALLYPFLPLCSSPCPPPPPPLPLWTRLSDPKHAPRALSGEGEEACGAGDAFIPPVDVWLPPDLWALLPPHSNEQPGGAAARPPWMEPLFPGFSVSSEAGSQGSPFPLPFVVLPVKKTRCCRS